MSTTTTLIVNSTKIIPTKCPLPADCVCVTKDWILANERFTITESGGLDLALYSSMIIFVYILISFSMYNWRSCCKSKKVIQISVTRLQRVINFMYLLFLIAFEVVWIYGHQFGKNNGIPDENKNIPRPIVIIIIIWVISDTIAVSVLFFGFFTNEY